jgi:hypothetical protein
MSCSLTDESFLLRVMAEISAFFGLCSMNEDGNHGKNVEISGFLDWFAKMTNSR